MMNELLINTYADALCIAVTRITDIPECEVLHFDELKYITSACSARRMEFTAGRYAAKSAAKALCGELPEMPEFPVCYGTFGEPVMKNGLGVSISHDGNIAAAVCWKRESPPVGIDIHRISGIAFEVREGFLSKNDEINLDIGQYSDKELICSYAWCAKESLSKLIFRGLTAIKSIELISISSEKENRRVLMLYENKRYVAYILRKGDILMSLCVPEAADTIFTINDLGRVI